MMTQSTSTRVAIVGGARTPFAKAGTALKKFLPLELAVHSVNGLLNLHPDLRAAFQVVLGMDLSHRVKAAWTQRGEDGTPAPA